MRILYVGTMAVGGTCRMRMEALQTLGHQVESIAFDPGPLTRDQVFVSRVLNKLGQPPDWARANERLRERCEQETFDLVWIDKGTIIRPGTLRAIRDLPRRPRIVGYSPDDMAASHNSSLYFLGCLPLYDTFVSTKSYAVKELTHLGCPRVIVSQNGYDPAVHRPVKLTPDEEEKYGCDVGFIGTYEPDRAADMLFLEANGVPVRVFGGTSWMAVPERHRFRTPIGPGIMGPEYAKVICGSKINLGFLRKINRDLQTTRSVEIPACGVFMLAERTSEHLALFEEGREAEFFSSREEMLEKARYYIAHPVEREQIAAAGRQRCITGGYSYVERIRTALAEL